jgi:retron-type reverse transcriptase
MKLTDTQLSTLRTKFSKLQSKEDLLNLINEIGFWVYGDKSFPFKMKQLTWYANPSLGGDRYFEFQIKKKSGGERSIHAPVNGLRSIQRILNVILQSVFQSHPAATGFVPGKSIVDNARIHINQRYVYNIDLKDFFPSIEQARVWKLLQLPPFNLNKETSLEVDFMPWEEFKTQILKSSGKVNFTKYRNTLVSKILIEEPNLPEQTNPFFGAFRHALLEKYQIKLFASAKIDLNKPIYAILKSDTDNPVTEQSQKKVIWLVNEVPTIGKLEIANIIAGICCTELEVERKGEEENWVKLKKNVLPQGAPTSPTITNIICKKMDHRLGGAAKRFGLRYTRYADDITFSSMHNVYQEGSEFIKEIQRIISDQGFEIKSSKTRLQKDGFRKEVTGLTVNEKVNVSKRYIKQIRMWLYYWERYGYNRAYTFFLPHYKKDKGHILKGRPDMGSVIEGKLNYLKMVRGEDELYKKLWARFSSLSGLQKKENISRESHLSHVLEVLMNSGLDQALEIYKPLDI